MVDSKENYKLIWELKGSYRFVCLKEDKNATAMISGWRKPKEFLIHAIIRLLFFVLQSVHSVEVFQRMTFFVKGTQDKVHHAQMKKNVVETP